MSIPLFLYVLVIFRIVFIETRLIDSLNLGKMKPDILAKVSNQAATLYSEASRCVGDCSQTLPKEISQAVNIRRDKFLVSVCLIYI